MISGRHIVAIACCLFLLANPSIFAQSLEASYNIRVLGMDVGKLKVTEERIGNDIIVEAITEVSVRIIFRFRVKYMQNSVYRDGALLQSSILTYKKGKLNSSTHLLREGDGYRLIKDGDTSFVHAKINYSGSLLYFHEPKDITYLYYEFDGVKKPIRKVGDHTYVVKDPRNGRESVFEYKDGVLMSSAIEHRLASIYTERLPD